MAILDPHGNSRLEPGSSQDRHHVHSQLTTDAATQQSRSVSTSDLVLGCASIFLMKNVQMRRKV